MVRDALVFAGLGCILFGCWQAWPPLAWMVGGIAIGGFGVLLIRAERNKRSNG